ncbi:MAG: hypothetical protein Ta2F_17550 [Termitinemataceae bacterium]|nr:MAG: hypothetical protein Ta2F_17550 [Termitinemataceae bacterium]
MYNEKSKEYFIMFWTMEAAQKFINEHNLSSACVLQKENYYKKTISKIFEKIL